MAKQLGSVVVGDPADPGYAGQIVAVQKGFFTKHGVNATLRIFASGAEAQQAMLAGDVDVTMSSETFTILGKVQKGNFSIVSELNTSNANNALVARKEIQSPRDLIGKKVGYTSGIGPEYMMLRYLAKYFIDKSQLTLVDIAANNIVPVFAKGDVDAIFTFRPRPEQALATVPGAHVLAWNGDIGYLLTTYNLFGAKLTANRELATACLSALIDAEKFMADNPEETVSIVSSATKLDADTIKNGIAVFPTKIRLTPDSLRAVQDVAIWLRAANRVQTDPDWPTFFNLQPLQDAAPDRLTLKQ